MKRMKRNLKRALSLVLALALVLGMTSVSALADDDTDTSTTTTTESVELEAGGTVTYTVDGDYTSADTSAIEKSVATVSIEEKAVTADGGSYYLQYTRGDYTYYLTFSVDSGTLSIGTVTSYSSATPVIYGTDSSLSFTSDGTTYYLNNTTGTALTADDTASTTWSYSTTAGFYCTVNSVAYYLGSFAGYVTTSTSPGSAAPSGSTMITYDFYGDGVYTLSNGSDTYFSLSNSSNTLITSEADSADDATAVTFDGSNLYFTDSSDESVYYLDINTTSASFYTVTSSSRLSTYKAAWIYDPDYGFYCMKSGTLYYIKLTYDSSSSSYSLGLSTSYELSDGESFPTLNATTEMSFQLKCNGYYLALSGSTNALTTLSVTSSGGTVFYYTTDGHLYFTDNDTKYYLVVSNEESLSVTTDADEATEVAFKLANGSAWSYGFSFAYTDSDKNTSDTMYLSGSPVLASSEQTTITFTGVAAGTTSVTIGDVTYSITTYTDIITLYVGDTYVAGIEGSYTSSDLSGLDTTIATADFDETTVGYTNATVSADGETAYILGYKSGGVKYYFTLDYSDSALVTGTVLNYYDGTSVLFESDGSTSSDDTITGYLKFTASDGTAYYLNLDSNGALTASTTKSTVWSYDSTNGFTCSYTDSDSNTSTLYLLDLLAATNPGGTVLLPMSSITSGSYVLQYSTTSTSGDDEETTTTTTNYLTFSVSGDTLTVGTATSSSSGTAVTYTTDGYLTFTSGSTTYYLNVTSDGSLSATSDESSAAAWSYSPTNGFSCTVDSSGTSTTYYLSGTEVSSSSGTNVVTFAAATNLSFALGYAGDSLTFYIQFSGSYVSNMTTDSGTGSAYQVTYTADGYLKTNSYYLNVSDGKLVMSDTASTVWTFDPGNGFYTTDASGNIWYLTDFLAFTSDTSSTAVYAYGQTTGTDATAITFTGVSAGTTTATLSSSDTEGSTSYVYKIIVLDEPEYVTSETSPFVGSSVTVSTYNTSSYATVSAAGYGGYPVTGLYLSLGLSYAIALNTSTTATGSNGVVVSSGGTWTIADGSVATFADGSTTLTDEEGTAVTIVGVSAGETTLTYTTTDGDSYTIPITIKDFWGYTSASSTSIKVLENYITEITDTTAYMAVMYGASNSAVSNVDFLEISEGEVVFLSFPYDSAYGVDYFGAPDEGYALTLLGSTGTSGHYMALDSDSPGETEFVSLATAAGYNQAYYFGSAAVFSAVQAALDYGSDGGMGFTRRSGSGGYGNASSMITVRSQQLPTVDKEIATITRTYTDSSGNKTTDEITYTEGMVIQEGDVINYTVSITQYATTEAITYTNELLSDSLRVKIYLVYTIDSDGKVEGTSTTDADEATEVTFTASSTSDANTGYLAATIDGRDYYLYLNSDAELCGTTTKSEDYTWSYNLGTGLSYTVSSTVYYLAGSAITTTSGTNVVSILQRDNDSYVLGYSGIETYLTYSWDSDSEKLTVGTASATDDAAVYDNATGMTFSDGYLSFTQGNNTYYLTVTVDGSTGSLTATSTKTEAVTWTYSASTGFSCEVSELTYYLSASGIQGTPPSHVILCRLRDANTAVLGYGSRSSTLKMSVTTGETTSSATQYQVSETDSSSDAQATLSNLNLANTTLTEDTTYTYTVSYTVQKSDIDLLLTNTVSLTYSYQSEYSSNVQAVATAASASVTILSFSMDDIVIDYGLPVDMDYATDCSNHSITLTEEGAEAEHGTISVENNVVTYTLTEPLSEADTVNVYNTGGGYYTFHVYPATQMYYEEDFGEITTVTTETDEDGNETTETSTQTGLIEYSNSSSSGTWSTVYQKVTETTAESETDGTTETTETSEEDRTTETTETSETDGTTETKKSVSGDITEGDDAEKGDAYTYSEDDLQSYTQETGVVGDTTDSVYGSDAAYKDSEYSTTLYDSELHSEKANVSSKPAAFRYYFTGTGTTIYSRTSEDSAYISVKLTYVGDDDITYEGEPLSSGETAGTWYIDTRNVAETSNTTDSAIYGGDNDDATLYNIPVYDITDLPYGDWKVYVYVYKSGTSVDYIYKTTTVYPTDYYMRWSTYDSDGNFSSYVYTQIYTDGTTLYYKSSTDDDGNASWGLVTSTSVLYTKSSDSVTDSDTRNTNVTTSTVIESANITTSSTNGTSAYVPVANSNQSGSVFYLDGVRVYDPAGDTAPSDDEDTTDEDTTDEDTTDGDTTDGDTTDGDTTDEDTTDDTSISTTSGVIDSNIYKAYKSDGENDPVVLNISDAVFSSSDSFATLTDIYGNITDTSVYTSYGPNNELYLYSEPESDTEESSNNTDETVTESEDNTEDMAVETTDDTDGGSSDDGETTDDAEEETASDPTTVSFYILNWDSSKYKIYLGMKSPNGSAATVTVGETTSTESTDTNSTDTDADSTNTETNSTDTDVDSTNTDTNSTDTNADSTNTDTSTDNSFTLSNSVDCYYDISSYLTSSNATVTKTTTSDDGTATTSDETTTVYKVTVTVSSGLASLTNIKVIGASGCTIADSDSYTEGSSEDNSESGDDTGSDTGSSDVSETGVLTFASINADWIEIIDDEDDSSGDDTSGDGSSGTDEDTDNTDNTGDTDGSTDSSGSDTSGSDTSGSDTSGSDTSDSGSGDTDNTTGNSDSDTGGTDDGSDSSGSDTGGTDDGSDSSGSDTGGTDDGSDSSGSDTGGTDDGSDSSGSDTGGTDDTTDSSGSGSGDTDNTTGNSGSDTGGTDDTTDTSGSGSGETGNTTGTSDTSDSGLQDAGGTADDMDTGSSGTQDSNDGSDGADDSDGSTQSTAVTALQIKSVKATFKNGKTTLKVTTSSSVKTLKVAGKSVKLTKTGKNKNVFTVKLNKDRRGKAVKMVMKSSTGKKKTKKILIPKKFKVTAKYKAKTKKTTVTIKTSREVTKVKVNGKKAKRKKTKNGYTYTITLSKKKKGSSVNVVGYNKKKAATITYSVKVK